MVHNQLPYNVLLLMIQSYGKHIGMYRASRGAPNQKLLGKGKNFLLSDAASALILSRAGAHFEKANLQEAQLQGANLAGGQLQRAYLGEAELQEANLEGAQLQKVSLYRAQLQGAYLREAQLQGADLRKTGLDHAAL